jgi:hypothetical protein
MTTVEDASFRALATRVLIRRAGPDADGAGLAAAAGRASDELARVLTPLIGGMGIAALAARAVHLAQREYAWLPETRRPEQTEGLFNYVRVSLEKQDPAVAAEAAAAVLSIFIGLLVRLIGEPLTARVMRQAWPDGFSDAGTAGTEETA